MKLSHPKGLYVLFLTEMWERFGFYAMLSLFTLYLSERLGYSDSAAYLLFGAYSSYAYLTTVAGGAAADRFLGFGPAILIGGALLAAGYFLLAASDTVPLALALGVLVIGNGFFKPNVSSLVGRLYAAEDPRREAGFTLFYMGINTGAVAATLIAGPVAQRYGYDVAFAMAGAGLLIALATFLIGRRCFTGIAGPPAGTTRNEAGRHLLLLVLAIVAGTALAAFLMRHAVIAGELLAVVGVLACGLFLRETWREPPIVRRRMIALIVLIGFAIFFFTLYQQQGLSVLLFIARDVNRAILGLELTPSQIGSLNPIFILALAPVLAILWERLGHRAPGNAAKVMLGLVSLASGFAILAAGIAASDGSNPIGLAPVAVFFLMLTVGELLVSPVCLALVTRLAPLHLAGFAMGMWFLGTALANYLGGLAAALADVDRKASLAAQEAVYDQAFFEFAAVLAGSAVLLFLLRPWLNKMMHGGNGD